MEGRAGSGPANKPHFGRLDRAMDELREEFPGWRIWYVRHAVGSITTWCAQLLPLLEADSAGALAEAIVAAEASGPVALADTLSGELPADRGERWTALDRLREELRSTFPNWNIWYTVHVAKGTVTWEAQRPPIHAYTAETLARDIRSAKRSCVPGRDVSTVSELNSHRSQSPSTGQGLVG